VAGGEVGCGGRAGSVRMGCVCWFDGCGGCCVERVVVGLMGW
jgi:hypothetical protein